MGVFNQIDLTKGVDTSKLSSDVVQKEDKYANLTPEDEEMLSHVQTITPAEDRERYLDHLINDYSADVGVFYGLSRVMYQNDVVETLFKWYDLADMEHYEYKDRDYQSFKQQIIDKVLINKDWFSSENGNESGVVSYKDTIQTPLDETKYAYLIDKDGIAADKYKMRKYVAKQYMLYADGKNKAITKLGLPKQQYPPHLAGYPRFDDYDDFYNLVERVAIEDAMGDTGHLGYCPDDNWFAPFDIQKDIIKNDVERCVRFVGRDDVNFEHGIEKINGYVRGGVDPAVVVDVINDEITVQGKNEANLTYIVNCLQSEMEKDSHKVIVGNSIDGINTKYAHARQDMMEKNELNNRRKRERQQKHDLENGIVRDNMTPLKEGLKDTVDGIKIAHTGKSDGDDGPDF